MLQESAQSSPDWKTQLSWSSEVFARLVRPDASRLLGGHFEIVEAVTATGIAKTLDVLSGVDLWLVRDGHGVRAVASRVQKASKSWRTFTVRRSRDSGSATEYEKRKQAFEHEYLYPHLTLQAYVNESADRLLGFAVMRTRSLWAMIEAGLCTVNRTGADQNGQASFYVVRWDDVSPAGYTLVEFAPSQ